MPSFLDTNVLLYSIGRSPKESRKRERALELLEDDSAALSIQVLQEFYVQATRATRKDALPPELAAGLIEAWSRFRVQEMTFSILRAAVRIHRTHRLSFWDGSIVAAAVALGCDRIYTEDLNDGQVIEGVEIVNPFAEH
ncbi:MAG: PIN domain-containing protein [Bryobacteraceae bacterium]|nr:PIN domain-containing protein [Bryobacteraceae bacterium]